MAKKRELDLAVRTRTVNTVTRESFILTGKELIELLRAAGQVPAEGDVVLKLDNQYGADVGDLYVESVIQTTETKAL